LRRSLTKEGKAPAADHERVKRKAAQAAAGKIRTMLEEESESEGPGKLALHALALYAGIAGAGDTPTLGEAQRSDE
jgi:hypothetical protein